MTNILVYGIHELFDTYGRYLDDDTNVVAISDNDISLDGIGANGVSCCPVCKINDFEFDYVVVFYNDNINDIVEMLNRTCDIQIEKIIGYKDYLRSRGHRYQFCFDNNFYIHSLALPRCIPNLLKDYNCRYACDFDFGLARIGIKGREYFDDFSDGHNHFTLYGCQLGGWRVTVSMDI